MTWVYIPVCIMDDQCKFDEWSKAAKASALWQPGGMEWGEEWGGRSGLGRHMYTHGWFMLTYGKKQYCKVITFQLNELKNQEVIFSNEDFIYQMQTLCVFLEYE